MEAEVKGQTTMMFGYSLDSILSIANVLYLICLAGTVLFSVVIWRLSSISNREKDRALEAYKERAGVEIAAATLKSEEARATAALANQSAAIANKDAATAQERASLLEKQAEEARLEQERLKAQLAWRTLTPEIVSGMQAVLSRRAGSVTVAYTAGDPEAMYLAIQIANVFNGAKWVSYMEPRTYTNTLFVSIIIPGPESELVSLVRSAFASTGIKYFTQDVPTPAMSFKAEATPDVTVMVGSKPLPYPLKK